jgi:Protein of unknown function (DUF2939)
MKRVIPGLALLVVLLAGYLAWPFLGLRSLALDLETRDAAALGEQVDFVRLRRSLTEQIIAAYLRVTGKANKLGVFGNAVASALGASIADPFVSQVINPANLVELLSGDAVPTDLGKVSFNIGQLREVSLSSAWRAWLSSDYGFGRFSVGVPVTAAPADQFRVRLQLLQWRWKLTGIELPDSVRDRFARELAKKFP